MHRTMIPSDAPWKRTLLKNSSQKYQGDKRNPFHFIAPKDMTQNIGLKR